MVVRRFAGIIAISIVSALVVGCAANTDEENDETLSADSDLTSTFQVAIGQTKTVRVQATTTRDVALTIDCAPPGNPDDQGPVLKVAAPTLGIDEGEPARAGYLRHTASVSSGRHEITIQNTGRIGAQCTLKTSNVPASATCRAYDEWRSPNTDHTHYPVGSEGAAAGWEPFPASGNHWGAWAMWNTVYPKAIKRGFLLHNLEHGGVVFSYKCSTQDESAACTAARDKLIAIAQTMGGPRVVITPDPTQPTMFAIRAWRYAYTSDCLDDASATTFARAHYAKGREDTDADPPIPFDPSTTDVPCEDLMSAPDSC